MYSRLLPVIISLLLLGCESLSFPKMRPACDCDCAVIINDARRKKSPAHCPVDNSANKFNLRGTLL